jgi:hypothetical protein
VSSSSKCSVVIHSERGKETKLEVTGECESICRRKAATQYTKKIREEYEAEMGEKERGNGGSVVPVQ